MSFSFGGAQSGGGGGAGGAQATAGPDLEQIDTEQVSFQPIAGDDKLRLLPAPWPSDSQPPAPASLLSIASAKGLVAAASPDTLVVAKTDTVRNAFTQARNDVNASAEGQIREFEPEARLSIPRVSQVAFSSDESCLVLTAQEGGGLAVYSTDAITSGKKEAEFQVSTNGVSVRELLPNPNPSAESAHLFAIVLETGQLLLADLKARELKKSGSGNPVFHENVLSACWSRLGKQVVAGRKDGTAVQIDQQGNVKAEIPLPPKLPELSGTGSTTMPLMSIYWIDTNEFLLMHTPEQTVDEMSDAMPEASILHLARRENAKSTNWTFQSIMDPTPAFAMGGRTPAHHFVQRLKDWPPNLDDVLLLISTASSDVGMMTKSSTPLDSGNPVTGAFTTTLPPDVRRAGMPLSIEDGASDTSPIGMALDLSVKELISKPIPKDEEINESPVPLPALYLLNNEGMLKMWYVVYNDSVRQKSAFPDLIAAGGPRPLDAGKKEGTPQPTPPSSASLFGGMSQPASRPTTSSGPAFGAPSTPGFGGASALGSKPSPWSQAGAGTAASGPTVPKPAFGSSTPLGGGGGFGQIGGLGQKSSPWATQGQAMKSPTASAAPKFGQPSTPFGGNAAQASPFATAFGSQKQGSGAETPRAPAPSGSLFGGNQPTFSFGGLGAKQGDENKSPWQRLGENKPAFSAEPSFGSTATLGSNSGNSFGGGSTAGGSSLFGTPSQNGAPSFSFGKPSLPASREETMGEDREETPRPAEEENKPKPGGLFGLGNGGFKLGSTFKSDGTAKDDLPKPKESHFFGGGFVNALGETEQKRSQPVTPIKQEPGTEKEPNLNDIPPAASTTPASPPKQEQYDPLTAKGKRFAGDVPPSDVPVEMPKRVAGDVPPSDVPADMPKRLFGDVPPTDVPGGGESKPAVELKKEEEAPVAGSPPIDLGNERFSEAAGSEEELPAGPEDDEDEDWGEEGEEDEEGEDADEEDEDDEDDEDPEHEVTDPDALSSFEARITPASPKRLQQPEESTTPATERKPAVPSYTPAGFPNPPVSFTPKVQESPRSPSPVRNFTAPQPQSMFGQTPKSNMPPPSFTPSSRAAPVPAQSKQLFGEVPQSSAQAQPQRIAVPPAKLAPERTAALQKPAEPTTGGLNDEEDARVKAILDSRPEPTKTLAAFLAHQNYERETDKTGIGGQIERVYRDVNSMLDTLGLNAHLLQGFVDGQMQLKQKGERTREDLGDEKSWTLDEASQLVAVQDEIEHQLQSGKLEDVKEILEDLQDEGKETLVMRTKFADLKKRIKTHTDPEQVAAQHAAPLPDEAQTQQSELRQGVQRVQTLLGQVEGAMSMLRAELASAANANAATTGPTHVPTVEAVTNTILKMTAMIEKKSGDVDVLESQIRKLPKGLASSLKLDDDYEDQLVAGLTGSKLLMNGSTRTPPTSRSRMLANGDAPGMSGMLCSRLRTPPSASASGNGRRSLMFSPGASRLGMSTGSVNGSARKKMNDVTDEEVTAYHTKALRRRKVLDALRDEVERKGEKVVRLER